MLTNHNMMTGSLPAWYPNAARELARMYVMEMISIEDYAIQSLHIRCVASSLSKKMYHHKLSWQKKEGKP